MIEEYPAFTWWVKDMLTWINLIIVEFKSKYWCTTHNFSIYEPNSVKDSPYINIEMGMNIGKNTYRNR